MTLPTPHRRHLRCSECHRPASVLYGGLGESCARERGLLPSSPRLKRWDQQGEGLFATTEGEIKLSVELLRKKPISVETMRWDGTSEREREILDWVADVEVDDTGPAFRWGGEGYTASVWNSEECCWIPVPVGHRVVKGALGELYPLSPDAEAATFERVSAEPGE